MSKPNLEILAYEERPLGPLCLRRRELLSAPGTIVPEVTLNQEFLMSSLYTDSERALAPTAIEMHGGENLRVLPGGKITNVTFDNVMIGGKKVTTLDHFEHNEHVNDITFK